MIKKATRAICQIPLQRPFISLTKSPITPILFIQLPTPEEKVMIRFSVNGVEQSFEGDSDMPLLWYLRDDIDLKGTKYGCGIAACGACTIHVDGEAVRSCSLPMSEVNGIKITTIEGLAGDTQDHPVQKAWAAHDVPQCGYCQAGQMMQAAALLSENPDPSDADIDEAMQGNICRCGTYQRIKAAIKTAAGDNK